MEHRYNWKRFWLPYEEDIILDNLGFFQEPMEHPFIACNYNAKSLDELDDKKFLFLTGDTGSGKSISAAIYSDKSEDVLITNDINTNYIIKKHLNGSLESNHVLFLDGLDECNDPLQVLENVISFFEEIDTQNTFSLRILCRDSVLEQEHFNRINDIESYYNLEANSSIYKIAPLTKKEFEVSCEYHGIDPISLLKKSREKLSTKILTNPITLMGTLDYYLREKSFPDKRSDIYEVVTLKLIKEEKEKEDALSLKRKYHFAKALAAAQIFSNQNFIDSNDSFWGDVCDSYRQSYSKISDDLFNPREVAQQVIDSGLYQGARNKRSCIHRSYLEYLAAKFISENDKNSNRYLNLLTIPLSNGNYHIPTYLQGTSIWCAELSEDALKILIDEVPELLMYGDFQDIDPALKLKTFNNLLSRIDNYETKKPQWGWWTGKNYVLLNFKCNLVENYIVDNFLSKAEEPKKYHRALEFIIDVISECRFERTADTLFKLVNLTTYSMDSVCRDVYICLARLNSETSQCLIKRTLEFLEQDMAQKHQKLAQDSVTLFFPDLMKLTEVIHLEKQYPDCIKELPYIIKKRVNKEDLDKYVKWLVGYTDDFTEYLCETAEEILKYLLSNNMTPEENEHAASIIIKISERQMHISQIIKKLSFEIQKKLISELVKQLAKSKVDRFYIFGPPGIGFSYFKNYSTSLEWVVHQHYATNCLIERDIWLSIFPAITNGSNEFNEVLIPLIRNNPEFEVKYKHYLETEYKIYKIVDGKKVLVDNPHVQWMKKRWNEEKESRIKTDRIKKIINEALQKSIPQDQWKHIVYNLTRNDPFSLNADLWKEAIVHKKDVLLDIAQNWLINFEPTDLWLKDSGYYWINIAPLQTYKLLMEYNIQVQLSIEQYRNLFRIALFRNIYSNEDIFKRLYLKVGETIFPEIIMNLPKERFFIPGDIRSNYQVLSDEHLNKLIVYLQKSILEDFDHNHAEITFMYKLDTKATIEFLLKELNDVESPCYKSSYLTAFLISIESSFYRDTFKTITCEAFKIETCKYLFDINDFFIVMNSIPLYTNRELMEIYLLAFKSEFRKRDHYSTNHYSIINYLVDVGALKELESICEAQNIEGHKYSLLKARQNIRDKENKLFKPYDLFHLLISKRSRSIRSEYELFQLVLELLGDYQRVLKSSECPLVEFHWNNLSHQNKEYRWPIGEEKATKLLRYWLNNEITKEELIIHSESQININDRTDLEVEVGDFKVILEAKGAWNTEIHKAAKIQLRDKYLKRNRCNHGIYLIYHYPQDQWFVDKDKTGGVSKKNSTYCKKSFEELKAVGKKWAIGASSSSIIINSFVLDLGLPMNKI